IRRSARQAGEPGARAVSSAAKTSLPLLMSMARSWASQPETKALPSAMAGAELTRSPALASQTWLPSAALRQKISAPSVPKMILLSMKLAEEWMGDWVSMVQIFLLSVETQWKVPA